MMPDGMRAAHERHGDADEAVAGGEFEQQAVLVAHELVDREAAGQRAGEHHGDDGDAGRRDAGIDRRTSGSSRRRGSRSRGASGR